MKNVSHIRYRTIQNSLEKWVDVLTEYAGYSWQRLSLRWSGTVSLSANEVGIASDPWHLFAVVSHSRRNWRDRMVHCRSD